MRKKTLVAAAVFLAGLLGLVSAEDSSSYFARSSDRLILKYGLDLNGSQDYPAALSTSTFPAMSTQSVSVDTGSSILLEYQRSLTDIFSLGLGMTLNVNRLLHGTASEFRFLPVYAALSFYPLSYKGDFVPYVKADLGYSFSYSGNDEYKKTADFETALTGGVYWGIGAGAKIFDMVFADVMFTSCSGAYKSTLSSVSSEVSVPYTKISLNVGIGFGILPPEKIALVQPEIDYLSPAYGSVDGGTNVTIAGSGFTGANGVTFDMINAASFTVNSDKEIMAVAPPHAVAIINVRVANPQNTSAIVFGDTFAYYTSAMIAVLEKLVVLADTHFEYDKSNLTKEGEAIVIQNIQILKEAPDVDIRIAGYTSASGTIEHNQTLSEERAKAVEKIFLEGGIAKERLSTIGYGETRPARHEVIPTHLDSQAARANMRVLFEIKEKSK